MVIKKENREMNVIVKGENYNTLIYINIQDLDVDSGRWKYET